MHELSIALEIIETSINTALQNNGKIIKEIEIDVGDVSGVDREALALALESAKMNSIAENANIVINPIPAIAICNNCNKQIELTEYEFLCSFCYSMDINVISGKELKIKHIIIE